ncbi:MAG: Calx-beta domain-containing protein, partial [FCB group bacterium]|nr:Calx-beta domain-containing protein [FCB group bacterium]
MSRIGHILSVVTVAWAFAGIAAAQTTVGFGGAASDGPESLATPVIAVRLSAASTEEVTVHYSVTGGTATRGDTPAEPADYALADGDLTFPPGAVTRTIPIAVVDDDKVEEPETVLLTLSAPTNATLGAQSTHTFTIRDDDAVITPVVEFGATASAGKENLGTAKLVVQAYPPPEDAVSVDYSVSGGSASAGDDYALAAGTLTFAAGETVKVIPLAIVDDDDVEGNESVTVRLSNAQGAVLGYKETHTFTIIDNDKAPDIRVSFQAPKSSVKEDVGTATFTVIVTGGPIGEAVTVDYGISGGSAQTGGDFTAAGGSLTFTGTDTVKTFTVDITDDTKVEPPETLGFFLTNPVNAKLGTYAFHELTILDNDLPLVSFVQAASGAEEGSGVAVVGLQLSEASFEPVLVDYSLGGTATQGEDYSLRKGTVTFKPGDTVAPIAPDILEDETDEPDETLALTLGVPLNGKLGEIVAHTLTIQDNDEPEKPSVSFEVESTLNDEFVPELKIAVQLSHEIEQDVTATVIVDGTATGGEDYRVESETVTFRAGSTRTFVTGSVTDDKLDEAEE